jgi:hypothetical protein
VSRARTTYIYRNSIELSGKKITRDFRLTHLQVSRDMSYGHVYNNHFDLATGRQ